MAIDHAVSLKLSRVTNICTSGTDQYFTLLDNLAISFFNPMFLRDYLLPSWTLK